MGLKEIIFTILFLFILSDASFSMVADKQVCPNRFEADIEKVEELPLNYGHLTKVKVTFSNQKIITADDEVQDYVITLKYGPVKFIEGDTYVIEMMGKSICFAERV